jgi:hypothetical protein
MSQLYVQVLNDAVKHCWDTKPTEGVGNNGWKEAIEVKPEIVAGRQRYAAHVFDITKDPVEIVYPVIDITVDERKAAMLAEVKAIPKQLERSMATGATPFDAEKIAAAETYIVPKVAAINACTSHDDLEAL